VTTYDTEADRLVDDVLTELAGLPDEAAGFPARMLDEQFRRILHAAGVRSVHRVRFRGDGECESIDEHLHRCEWVGHFRYVFGVYDVWGQRVNSYQSLACCTGPDPDPASCAAAQAPLWPGYSIAVWTDTSVTPPAKLRHGPPPDASSG
jgi:hypothetical protein